MASVDTGCFATIERHWNTVNDFVVNNAASKRVVRFCREHPTLVHWTKIALQIAFFVGAGLAISLIGGCPPALYAVGLLIGMGAALLPVTRKPVDQVIRAVKEFYDQRSPIAKAALAVAGVVTSYLFIPGMATGMILGAYSANRIKNHIDSKPASADSISAEDV